jgi:hypothetical protein
MNEPPARRITPNAGAIEMERQRQKAALEKQPLETYEELQIRATKAETHNTQLERLLRDANIKIPPPE